MQKAKESAINSALTKQKDERKTLKIQNKLSKNASKNLKIQSKMSKNSNKTLNSSKSLNSNKSLKIQSKNSKIQRKSPKNENKTQEISQKSLARQAKIKAVALKMFIANGYENTSLKDIIKKSGGSFTDIYAAFENKDGLFISVIEDMLKEKLGKYEQIFDKKLPLRETLLAFSLNIIDNFLQKKTIALLKILYSQLYNPKNQVLIEHFRQNREKKLEQILTDYFKSCPPPLCDKAEKYGELFFAMLRNKYLEDVLFFEIPLSQNEHKEYAEFIVDFFIQAVSK